VLEFLRSATGANGGYLFLWNNAELVLAAAAPGGEPPSGLEREALRFWNDHPRSTRSDNATVDLHGHMKTLNPDDGVSSVTTPSGTTFLHRVLTVHRDSQWVSVGIAMLEHESAQFLATLRRAHIDALCNALIDASDVQIGDPVPEPA
jgi:hypothetical protein